ncbi:EpsD family peptidyl-prolyl cis-trans isomerase [Nitrosomonas ureae]|uniref:peptidylprolyl isomerase n=1 Tax=Nitrosomonas ureae TaxID=44577 RepID=A0A0S3AM66_9PROT|nr:EpsD family peptidyl-prolyl cis-trans isomerase [Nitrosomonas ureae]ALQ52261.1 peptidyl-tRNA hydrolase [Nitrosomonas ureae]PXX10173.1 EpsD family peptidyl-prolyl cis-trans isomerase [Nitrosomonas ureae]SDU23957.1 peptidyl-prolyl cis-trans isomerase, EpsD family [Nitrosomonas ureae]SOD20836.1 peptidyl-prolyl cis-trans isomerase, EpsD family [Nitrosomonas ureae]
MVLAHIRMISIIGLVFITALTLTACDKEPNTKKSGQSIVSVNGSEITMLQLNDEIRRSNIRADQYESAREQLLESLIARQLIVDEAIRNKLDRTPEVMQARERANAQVIAQAYLQGIISKIAKPSKAEIEDYFQKNPELFAQRKQFDLTTVRIATREVSEELKRVIDTAKSIEEVVTWLDKNNIQYFRSLATRSSADLPLQLVSTLREKSKDTIFIINEQEKSILISVNAIKDNSVSETAAAPQIERFLINQKYKEATDAEIARLRTSAKIEYLNAKAPEPNNIEKSESQLFRISPENLSNIDNPSGTVSEGVIERGISGLK